MAESRPVTYEGWTERLAAISLPVQRATHDAIEYWRSQSDRVDANLLADVVLRDPLMCLRVLMNAARTIGRRLATPIETVTAALVLTGIEPFFRDFSEVPVLENQLADHASALAGALAAVESSHCAARLAAAFAIQRGSEDVELLHQAALLDNFAGLLIWTEAPDCALEMAQRQREDPTLRSVEVQREVLGVELAHLTRQLMERWELPASLLEVGQAGPHSARTVKLAVQIARHLQSSYHNAALSDDFVEVGRLLNLPPYAAADLVWQVAV